jgi:hypothetical protein
MEPRPANPYLILAASIVLPGSGHLLLGLASRALTFLFFIIVLGWVSVRIAPPEASFVGRHAGGIFIYAMSVIDAYRLARIRFEKWRYRVRAAEESVGHGGA